MDFSSIAAKAEALKLSSFAIAQGMKSGAFASLFRGRGIEFDSVRQYCYGDDARAIDWNVSARTGIPFVKLFAEERDIPVFVILDSSFSMSTGAAAKSRLEQAMDVAALIVFAADRLSCPAGGTVFDGAPGPLVQPASGTAHALSLLWALAGFKPSARGSALAQAVDAAIPILPPHSLAVILSDFRIEGLRKPLERLKGRCKVVAVRIADPADKALPGRGLLPFRDPESGRSILCRPQSASFRAAWKKENEERAALWRSICLKCAAIPFELSTEDDAAAALATFFASPHIGA